MVSFDFDQNRATMPDQGSMIRARTGFAFIAGSSLAMALNGPAATGQPPATGSVASSPAVLQQVAQNAPGGVKSGSASNRKKLAASQELRRMLNIGLTDDRNDLARLSDAELIAQLADTAKQLGVDINLNYSFAQPKESEG